MIEDINKEIAKNLSLSYVYVYKMKDQVISNG